MFLYKTDRQDGLPFLSRRGTPGKFVIILLPCPKTSGLARQLSRPLVQAREEQVVEVDRPDSVSDLFQRDPVPDQQLAQEELAILEVEDPVRAHLANHTVARILRLRQARRQLARRRLIQRPRRLHPDRLVRPLEVELAAE